MPQTLYLLRHAKSSWKDDSLSDFERPLKGRGRDAAKLIFTRFNGTWEVSEFLYNKPAVTFWRSVVTEFTQGKFKETTAHGEVHQVFVSPARIR